MREPINKELFQSAYLVLLLIGSIGSILSVGILATVVFS